MTTYQQLPITIALILSVYSLSAQAQHSSGKRPLEKAPECVSIAYTVGCYWACWILTPVSGEGESCNRVPEADPKGHIREQGIQDIRRGWAVAKSMERGDGTPFRVTRPLVVARGAIVHTISMGE